MQSCNLNQYQTSNAKWRAITHRDPAAHHSFVYGVTSTRVYCRPTCTARLARRANVIYYESRQQAEANGFRPCTKCKPHEASFMGQREEVVVRTLDLIRLKKDSLQVEGGLKELAKNVGVTPSYLCRVFKKTMGCTIGQYCREFEVAVCDGSVTPSSAPPSSHAGSVTPSDTSTWPPSPEPLSTASSPPQPVQSLAISGSEPTDQPWTGGEEHLDLNFDFAEWVWDEGFDFNDWMIPTDAFPVDHTYESPASWHT